MDQEPQDEIDVYLTQLSDEIPEDEMEQVLLYIQSLDTDDEVALKIAITNLGSSFDITKCSGYTKWKTIKK